MPEGNKALKAFERDGTVFDNQQSCDSKDIRIVSRMSTKSGTTNFES
jgi:hypothetical protein